jgi:hypothetical protein
VGNLKERNYYRGLVIDWREMLERIWKKYYFFFYIHVTVHRDIFL